MTRAFSTLEMAKSMCNLMVGGRSYRAASFWKARRMTSCLVFKIWMTLGFNLLMRRCDTNDPDVGGYRGNIIIICSTVTFISQIIFDEKMILSLILL